VVAAFRTLAKIDDEVVSGGRRAQRRRFLQRIDAA
jgi:hypothetical protein